MPGTDSPVDMPPDRSVSFAPTHPNRLTPAAAAWRSATLGHAVAGSFSNGAGSDRMNGYPIQPAKVQRPPLRDETLARDRLLDWLASRIHHRVILILADAGYGKTTLLADYSRRTRLRTLWYRLDDDDRDWVSFLNHLVAAGREHDPGFAPTTAALLSDMTTGGPTREAATDVFLRELASIAEHGAVLILDDFHLVDESPDVNLMTRELVARAPERLSIVFASRRAPTIPLARMRASGEVVEIGTDDLRFDAAETARLFSETYGRELEPDVLADVAARTEGWAASLQLVQAALRDRSPAEIRRFVRGLTGADQELYDYLAEEVVGDLSEELQQFLMRTSILQVVTTEMACVVTGLDADGVTRLGTEAERLTLLSRRTRAARGPQRYHPLVREFLEARLRATLSAAAVADLHRRAAETAASIDWRVAAHHYREAGDLDSVALTIATAIPEIMGSGQHATATDEIDRVPPENRLPVLGLVTSRMHLQRRDYVPAISLSHSVLEKVEAGSVESDYALLNLVTLYLQSGFSEQSRAIANELRESTTNEQLRLIADGTRLMVDASLDGSLVEMSTHLRKMASRQRGIHPHYYGVTMLNLAVNAMHQDDPNQAATFAREATEALEGTSSHMELSAAEMSLANPLTMLGLEGAARIAVGRALDADATEASLDQADLADSYTDPDTARGLLDIVGSSSDINARFSHAIQSAWFLARRGRFEEARSSLVNASHVESLAIGQQTARLVAAAYVAIASGSADGPSLASEAIRAARHQDAIRWERIATLLKAFCESDSEFGAAVQSVGARSPWNLTYVADLVARKLENIGTRALASVEGAASSHPGRWRFVLRREVAAAEGGEGLAAARLLEKIGDRTDIARLRAYARGQRKLRGASSIGRSLARRLADRVIVEDQGRVTLLIGDRVVPGSSIRRKVLALLCFLLTKPAMSSTRDQVLDALWPELDPPDALNSLNQTVYFLRRVLEEQYVDDLSPGYVHHDSDLIWLDPDLVSSRSNDCRQLIKSFPPKAGPVEVDRLVATYLGRFALDFEYEEWAAPFRDWLHAAYLEIAERAVTIDLETGHFERGIRLARMVLDVDPGAEHVEVSLLKLYRASGAHAAAAEQYAHYAAAIREQLGIEPPPLESL